MDQGFMLAQPHISRFDPMRRIIFFDDFDNGLGGWTELIGNYEGSLDTVLPPYRDHRPPQLSNLTMWDTGTNGAFDGTTNRSTSRFSTSTRITPTKPSPKGMAALLYTPCAHGIGLRSMMGFPL